MSEQIQAISQGNYILHNIDAKKLYVQEPLFTANSGDAVYVGWRPDETVLWSGTVVSANDTINLNESFENFERIRYEISEDNQYITDHIFECYAAGASAYPKYMYPYCIKSNNNGMFVSVNFTIRYDNNVSGTIVASKIRNDSWTASNNTSVRIVKIVGINRKENA